jgi:hypothetical protein
MRSQHSCGEVDQAPAHRASGSACEPNTPMSDGLIGERRSLSVPPRPMRRSCSMRCPTRRQLADHCWRFMPVPESQICSHSRCVKSAPDRRAARRWDAEGLPSGSRPKALMRSRRSSAGLPGRSGSKREAGNRSVDSPGIIALPRRRKRSAASGSRNARTRSLIRPLRSIRSIRRGRPPASPESPGLAGKPRRTEGPLASGLMPVARLGLMPEAGPVEGPPPGWLVWPKATPAPRAKVRHAAAIVVLRIATSSE